jgi:hypothetical protein
MVLVGVLIAAGIIAGVNALEQRNLLPSASGTTTTSTIITSTSVSTTTETSNTTGPKGTMAALMTDPSVFPPGANALIVTYSDIEVHTTISNSSLWVTIAGTGSVNLLALQNQSVTLGSALVASGTFDQIRFNVLSATLTYFGANRSVFVPNGQLISHINQNGMQLKPNSSAGVLLTLATTVLPYQNGPFINYVMMPSVNSTPVPSGSWKPELAKVGATLNLSNQSWFAPGPSSLANNFTKLITELSPSSVLLALQNNGNTSIVLSSLMVLGSSEQNASITTSTYLSTVTSVVTVTVVTTVTKNTTATKVPPTMDPANQLVAQNNAYSNSSSTSVTTSESYSSQNIPIAAFQIMNNSALVQPGQSVDPNEVGLVVPAGKQVVLLFAAEIQTLNSPTSPNLPTSIVGGQQYTLLLSTPGGAVLELNVTASYGP